MAFRTTESIRLAGVLIQQQKEVNQLKVEASIDRIKVQFGVIQNAMIFVPIFEKWATVH